MTLSPALVVISRMKDQLRGIPVREAPLVISRMKDQLRARGLPVREAPLVISRMKDQLKGIPVGEASLVYFTRMTDTDL